MDHVYHCAQFSVEKSKSLKEWARSLNHCWCLLARPELYIDLKMGVDIDSTCPTIFE